jgi:hypothetical protein
MATFIALAAGVSFAANESTELLSSCAISELKSCKMVSTSIKTEDFAKHEKLLNCLKHGSTSNDKFDLGVPLPEGGKLGIGFGSQAKYSKETCRDEVRKLESTSFLKQYTETFDAECGKTIGGQYEQCIAAAARVVDSKQIQNLQCTSSQSANRLIINTKYVLGQGEGLEQYRISSITGLSGVVCDENSYAGINRYASLSCILPIAYPRSELILKLGNGVSCTVPVQNERGIELTLARKYSCTGVYKAVARDLFDTLDRKAPLLGAALVGLCERCLSENIDTSESDHRTLVSRVGGCAAWALSTTALDSEAHSCSVKSVSASTPDIGHAPVAFGYSNPFEKSPPPAVLPTAPGSERAELFMLYLPTSSDPNSAWALSLCNGRKNSEIVQLHGTEWKKSPIDFLVSPMGKDPRVKAIVQEISNWMSKQ